MLIMADQNSHSELNELQQDIYLKYPTDMTVIMSM